MRDREAGCAPTRYREQGGTDLTALGRMTACHAGRVDLPRRDWCVA